jgi:acyl-CoA-binding protein
MFDHEFNGTSEELQLSFNEAAKAARNLGPLDSRDQLMMYGLYKQALRWHVESNAAPSKLNVVGRSKYNASKKFTGVPKHFAMQKYCDVVYHFVNGGASSFDDGKSKMTIMPM